MTWKSTAVVSGIGLLATWVTTSVPPGSGIRAPQPSPTNVSERATAASNDIQRQADRLQVTLHSTPTYAEPSRNLFRFGATAVPRAPRVRTEPPAIEEYPATPSPAPLQITLSGVAGDIVDGKEQRTAILSTPTGVLLVHEGDEVAGQYRVGAIGAEAVELVRLDDGGVRRLFFKP